MSEPDGANGQREAGEREAVVPDGASLGRPLVRGVACVSCQYPLDGLPTGGVCPECATEIRRSLMAAGMDPAAGVLGVVQGGHTCVSCGYALAGLPVHGKCPECGTDVQRSLRGFLLQYASPEYIGSLHTGLRLVLWGILGKVVLMVTVFLAGAAASGLPGFLQVFMPAVMGVDVLVSLVMAVGYWKVSEPDPQLQGMESPVTARVVLRASTVIGAVCTVVAAPQALVAGTGGGVAGYGLLAAIMGLAGLLGTLAWLVQAVAMLTQARFLGRRVPDRKIVDLAGRYRWVLPLISVLFFCVLFLGPLLAIVLYWNLLDRLRKHVKMIQERGVPAGLRGM